MHVWVHKELSFFLIWYYKKPQQHNIILLLYFTFIKLATIKSPLDLAASHDLTMQYSVLEHHPLCVCLHMHSNTRNLWVHSSGFQASSLEVFWWEITRMDFPEIVVLIHTFLHSHIHNAGTGCMCDWDLRETELTWPLQCKQASLKGVPLVCSRAAGFRQNNQITSETPFTKNKQTKKPW